MNRILKIFSSGPEQDALAHDYPVIERYPAFVLLDVSAKTAKKIARTHLTEDITSQYKIETSTGVIDTTGPSVRLARKAQTRAAPGDVKPLSRGKHHYLVQFAGPVKRSWLKELVKTGSRTSRTVWRFHIHCSGQPEANSGGIRAAVRSMDRSSATSRPHRFGASCRTRGLKQCCRAIATPPSVAWRVNGGVFRSRRS